MLVLGGLAGGQQDAQARVRQALADGSGLEKFRQIIEAQGGDPAVVDDYAKLPAGAHQMAVPAPRTGVVAAIDARRTGDAAVLLGAGRDRVDADVDPSAGSEILLPVGADVREGEAMAVVSGRDPRRVEAACRAMAGAVRIAEAPPPVQPLIRETLTAEVEP
jgi:thymidine phosphorylase